MSISKSLVSFPSASLCAAVALACSLTACGGGGGGNADGSHQPDDDDVSHAADASVGQARQPHQPSAAQDGRADVQPLGGMPSEEELGAFEDALLGILDNALTEFLNESEDYRFVGGQVIDPLGKTHTAEQWLRHVQQNCPRTAAGGERANYQPVSMAHIGCLAGTYIGQDAETEQACRVTLAPDGSVTLLHNGADRLLMRLSPDNARYLHGGSRFAGPDVQEIVLSGKLRQIQPDRQVMVDFGVVSGSKAGKTLRMLNIAHDDSDLTRYRPVVEGESSQSGCMLMVDIGKAAR
ncbi:MAG: hypothetical protein Q4B17_10465 [Lautropia sp.]|nr:hypothetical protein [Lautropia sp.]